MSLFLLILYCQQLPSVLSANVEEAVAMIDWIHSSGNSHGCAEIRGYISFEKTSSTTTSYSLTVPTIAPSCISATGSKSVTIAIYPLSRSFSGSSEMFGSSTDASIVYVTNSIATLQNTVTGNLQSTSNLKHMSSLSILGKAIVLSIDGNHVAAGTIGRRQVSSTNVNQAGGGTTQAPTLLCMLSDASMKSPATYWNQYNNVNSNPTVHTGSIVVSTSNGGFVVAAKFNRGFSTSSNHRLSFHTNAHVPENFATTSTPADAGAMLGNVLTYSHLRASTSYTLPCGDNRRAGDLGNFQGLHYYARLPDPTPTHSGWEQLIGGSCAIWKQPMRTCKEWEVGCTSYDSSDELIAVGVIGLSDNSARLNELGDQSLQPPSSGIDYDCMQDSILLATAHLYPTKFSGANSNNNYSGNTPIMKVVFIQSEITGSISISVSMITSNVPSWLKSSNTGTTLRSISIQTTGDGSFGEWDTRTLTNLNGTFHPNKNHRRALPPNALRRSGDLGSFDLTHSVIDVANKINIPSTFEYYMDTKFGESMISLNNIETSIIGRGIVLHGQPDSGLGEDSNRGKTLLFGVIGKLKMFMFLSF
jgi:hypothetical protein